MQHFRRLAALQGTFAALQLFCLLYLLYVCPISPVVFASSTFDQVCLKTISTASYIAYLTLASYITYPAFLESLPTQSGLLEQLAPVLPLQTSHRSLYF